MTIPQLKAALKELGATGYSKMTKAELIAALENARSSAPSTDSKKRKRDDDSEGSFEAEDVAPAKKPKVDADASTTSKSPGQVVSYASYLTDDGWKNLLKDEMAKPYFEQIESFVAQARKEVEVFPPDKDVLNAFNFTPLDQVRVVIIGQDPYFNPGQAHGICFSVKKGVKVPPSLNRMYKALEKTVPGFKNPKHGFLEEWAKRGVLMLNASLTVNVGKPNSHAKCGWLDFTKAAIKLLVESKKGLIFFCWGTFAQKLVKGFDLSKHHVLEYTHPSPMSGSEWNCTHFADANRILKEEGLSEIDWTLTP